MYVLKWALKFEVEGQRIEGMLNRTLMSHMVEVCIKDCLSGAHRLC